MYTSNNALVPDPSKVWTISFDSTAQGPDPLSSSPFEWPLAQRGVRLCSWADDVFKVRAFSRIERIYASPMNSTFSTTFRCICWGIRLFGGCHSDPCVPTLCFSVDIMSEWNGAISIGHEVCEMVLQDWMTYALCRWMVAFCISWTFVSHRMGTSLFSLCDHVACHLFASLYRRMCCCLISSRLSRTLLWNSNGCVRAGTFGSVWQPRVSWWNLRLSAEYCSPSQVAFREIWLCVAICLLLRRHCLISFLRASVVRFRRCLLPLRRQKMAVHVDNDLNKYYIGLQHLFKRTMSSLICLVSKDSRILIQAAPMTRRDKIQQDTLLTRRNKMYWKFINCHRMCFSYNS